MEAGIARTQITARGTTIGTMIIIVITLNGTTTVHGITAKVKIGAMEALTKTGQTIPSAQATNRTTVVELSEDIQATAEWFHTAIKVSSLNYY